MSFDIGSRSDATEQARLVDSGEASATELVSAAIEAAEQLNPQLNAIIHERYERALAEAAAIDREGTDGRALAGVPIVVKDLDAFMADEPYHAGSKHLADAGYVARDMSVTLERLIGAGAVIIGKTNTPELGLVPSTEPVAYGPTHNPWDPTRSPAGSSGGSAAAVAAGIVPIGHAGDGGGSIRLPASACGLVGLKPSRGAVPTFPDVEPWGGLVARLAVTRTVRDTALVLDTVVGADPLDPYQPRVPAQGVFREVLHRDPPRVRFGVATDAPDSSAVDPRIVEIVQRTAATLESLGHEFTPNNPASLGDPEFFGRIMTNFLTTYPVWVADSVAMMETMSGSAVTAETVEPHTWALAEMGRTVGALSFQQSLTTLMQAGREIRTWWNEGNDILVTPTVGELPWTLGQFGPTPENPMAAVMRSAGIVGFVTAFNISGQPAISVPVGEVDGLPVGVQMVAAWGREDLLLQLAHQLEQAMPWADRLPLIHA